MEKVILLLCFVVHAHNILHAEDVSEELSSEAQKQLEILEIYFGKQDIAEQSSQKDKKVIDEKQLHENMRDAFLELLEYAELYQSANKIPEELNNFFVRFNATPNTKIRDFAGTKPYVSLFRFATHAVRLHGGEGKLILLQEMMKHGGNPFEVEQGERFSLADENALTCVHLCCAKKIGFDPIYDYENASEEMQHRAEECMGTLCKNARNIQEIFEQI
jgi:hypothetical protein